jgi:hypothetical protein
MLSTATRKCVEAVVEGRKGDRKHCAGLATEQVRAPKLDRLRPAAVGAVPSANPLLAVMDAAIVVERLLAGPLLFQP